MEPIYKFECTVKYSRLFPKMARNLLIIGTALCVPWLIFAIAVLPGLTEKGGAVTLMGLAVLAVHPAVIMTAVHILRSRKTSNIYEFYADRFEVRTVKKKNKPPAVIAYSRAVSITETPLDFEIFISRHLCYIIVKECLGDISPEDFGYFLRINTGLDITSRPLI